MNNIILIGYMGAGKTTVGKLLSKINNMTFVDTDDLISENEGISISDIFFRHGEQYFRDLETSLLDDMCKKTANTVVSCGGGMPLREKNRVYLKKLGIVIYLSVSADTVFERLKGDTTRPLLAGDKNEVHERIKTMISERAPYYEDAADIVICVDKKSAEEIADNAIFKINEYENIKEKA